MRNLAFSLLFPLLVACNAAPPPAGPPAAEYCRPCCEKQPCAVACVDCMPESCKARADGRLCCAGGLRAAPDSGLLCAPPADMGR